MGKSLTGSLNSRKRNFACKSFDKAYICCSFCSRCVVIRDAEAEAGSGSGPFSVKVEAQKFHRFRFQIGGKNGERKEIGSAIVRRRANRGSINIKK